MARVSKIAADDISAMRQLAQSILEGVQTLEDTTIHPTWVSDDGVARDALKELASVREDLRRTDLAVWGAVEDLTEEMIP